MVSGSANGNPSSTTKTATMEGPMPYVDCFGEPPLLDFEEKVARMEILDPDDDMFSFSSEDFAAYNKQVFESDEELAKEFSGDAEFAIKEYNKKKGENFKVVGIEKTNVQAVETYNCYMTFTAVDEKALDDEPKIFQALVTNGILHRRVVELCRQKDDPSEGYYTDFGYKMVEDNAGRRCAKV